ncbi:Bug family tripartite tricarboxylate transporter substrate binding protein [Noviherbaspirillum malthae]|jgi:tripartite-type tricarboxylate transporter receptor subunit TctC|uniref:Bug family tripartite tricarboxylate transporter substrate binding protein n=1 Tax=Noviherbaspirillum malthae TaxID=1260987 RepID=UPI00188F6D4E|nr:tripartite tricarboxylate transporter substrate binding protein [Noviherbaspirillum malthae]
MKRRTFLAATAATAATLVSPLVRAQGPLSGPVKIIVGFPPGGGTDALARVVGQKLTTMWGVPVIVDNKPGAAGTIAADYVAKQPGDGSVLLMAHVNSHAISPGLMPRLSYNVERDFVPIAMVGVTPNLLICNPSQPVRSVKELVELCKRNPGKIGFGSAGIGSSQHLTLEMFKLRAGVDALHVPYKGSGPLLADLIGNQIEYSFDTMTAATPHVKSGKVIALAQTRPKRCKAYPNLQTMSEAGFPEFDASTWYGLVGPGKMPAALAQRMNDDVNKVLSMPDVMERLDQYGAEDSGGTREKFAEFIRSERQTWGKVIKDAKVTTES